VPWQQNSNKVSIELHFHYASMHCRRKDNVDETVQALCAKGLQVSGVVCHVGNAQHRSSLIQQTIQVK
jgi:hypothetical protein